MGTALVYLIVMLLVAAVVFLIAAMIFGRGEELEPLPPSVSPTRLPSDAVTSEDLAAVKFQLVLRGYKMSEVDWVLAKVGRELDALRDRVTELEQRVAEQSAGPQSAGQHGAAEQSAGQQGAGQSAGLHGVGQQGAGAWNAGRQDTSQGIPYGAER